MAITNINNQKVHFVTSNNSVAPHKLRYTGSWVIYTENKTDILDGTTELDRHSIYLGGEHIASGYGFDTAALNLRATYVAYTYNDVYTYFVDAYAYTLDYLNAAYTYILDAYSYTLDYINTSYDSLYSYVTDAYSYSLNYAESYSTNLVNKLIDGAPETLDTLKEIAEWISDTEGVAPAIIKEVRNLQSSVDTIEATYVTHNAAGTDYSYSNIDNNWVTTLTSNVNLNTALTALLDNAEYRKPVLTAECSVAGCVEYGSKVSAELTVTLSNISTYAYGSNYYKTVKENTYLGCTYTVLSGNKYKSRNNNETIIYSYISSGNGNDSNKQTDATSASKVITLPDVYIGQFNASNSTYTLATLTCMTYCFASYMLMPSLINAGYYIPATNGWFNSDYVYINEDKTAEKFKVNAGYKMWWGFCDSISMMTVKVDESTTIQTQNYTYIPSYIMYRDNVNKIISYNPGCTYIEHLENRSEITEGHNENPGTVETISTYWPKNTDVMWVILPSEYKLSYQKQQVMNTWTPLSGLLGDYTYAGPFEYVCGTDAASARGKWAYTHNYTAYYVQLNEFLSTEDINIKFDIERM